MQRLFFCLSLPLIQGHEGPHGSHCLVGGTDDAVAGLVDLLDAVGAPAHDTGHGKQGGVQLLGLLLSLDNEVENSLQ